VYLDFLHLSPYPCPSVSEVLEVTERGHFGEVSVPRRALAGSEERAKMKCREKNTWKTTLMAAGQPCLSLYNGSPLRSLPNGFVAYVTRIATSPGRSRSSTSLRISLITECSSTARDKSSSHFVLGFRMLVSARYFESRLWTND